MPAGVGETRVGAPRSGLRRPACDSALLKMSVRIARPGAEKRGTVSVAGPQCTPCQCLARQRWTPQPDQGLLFTECLLPEETSQSAVPLPEPHFTEGSPRGLKEAPRRAQLSRGLWVLHWLPSHPGVSCLRLVPYLKSGRPCLPRKARSYRNPFLQC